jgi:hypothetical protein
MSPGNDGDTVLRRRPKKLRGTSPAETEVALQEQADWEAIGGIEVDSATCAFAAASGLPQQFDMREIAIPPSPWRTENLVPVGIPLVACTTMEDLPLPVDVQRDDRGKVIAARMVFVDDFDDLVGAWLPVERLEIADGRCAALDPWIGRRESPYWLEFDVRPGTYEVAVFDHREEDGAKDRLGIMITASPTAMP